MDLLGSFEVISGLMVNPDKSEALNIDLEDRILKSLRTQYFFSWQLSPIPYLGVKLTPQVFILYSVNYPLLFVNLLEEVVDKVPFLAR